MTRPYPAATVDRTLAAKYLAKAECFRNDAENMAQLFDDFSGNGVAVLCVHAAIAFGDAITILVAGRRSKSGDHRDAAPFLTSVVPVRTSEDKTAIRAFQSILNRKDEVSYADDILDEAQAAALLERLRVFARWANRTLQDIHGRTMP